MDGDGRVRCERYIKTGLSELREVQGQSKLTYE